MRQWIILGVIANALVLLLAIGGSYALSLRAISEHQAVWCPLLADLTSHPGEMASHTFSELVAVRKAWC